MPGLFAGCRQKTVSPLAPASDIAALQPTTIDELQLAEGLDYQVLIRWGDPINESETFGFNNDFTCFLPFDAEHPDEGILWVNHEYVDARFVSGWDGINPKSREQVTTEQLAVGGSLLHIKKVNGKWALVANDPLNRRVSGRTPIPFDWDEPIKG